MIWSIVFFLNNLIRCLLILYKVVLVFFFDEIIIFFNCFKCFFLIFCLLFFILKWIIFFFLKICIFILYIGCFFGKVCCNVFLINSWRINGGIKVVFSLFLIYIFILYLFGNFVCFKDRYVCIWFNFCFSGINNWCVFCKLYWKYMLSCNNNFFVFFIFVWYKVDIVLIVLNKKCGLICVCNVFIFVFWSNLFCNLVFFNFNCVENIFVNFFVNFFLMWFNWLGFLKYSFNVFIVFLCEVSGIIIVVCKGYFLCW